MKIYSLEGNIGSGKTTFLNVLKEYYKNNKNFVFLQEPVSDWNEIVDSNNVNILTKYYSNQSKYAFSFQMMAFITRLKQLKDCIDKYSGNHRIKVITERSIFTDRKIFATMLFDSGKIEDIEYTIYLKWFDYFVKDIKITGIIYIKTNIDKCFLRINKRNREGESIEYEYLSKLNDYHNEWLKNEDNLLVLDGNIEKNEMIDNLDTVCEYLEKDYNEYIYSTIYYICIIFIFYNIFMILIGLFLINCAGIY
jgi:deoxyadenosine/deoxycytidine kinase